MPVRTTEMPIACILHGYQMTHTQRVPGSLHLSVSPSMSPCLHVSMVLPPAHATLPPAVQCVGVYVCVRVSIVIAAPFAQHLRLPTTTQVRYHYLAKAESQKLGPTIGSRLNALECEFQTVPS